MQINGPEPGQITTTNENYDHTMWPCPVQGRVHNCKEELKKWRPGSRTLKGTRTRDDTATPQAR